MPRQERPEDFNAFGYDPTGWVANHAGLMFGENWRPDQRDIPRHHGVEVAAPRYGPPADYQVPHLPNYFFPHLPHSGYLGALQYQARAGPWVGYPLPPPPPLYPGHDRYQPAPPAQQQVYGHPYAVHAPAPAAPPAAPPPVRSKAEVRPGGKFRHYYF